MRDFKFYVHPDPNVDQGLQDFAIMKLWLDHPYVLFHTEAMGDDELVVDWARERNSRGYYES